MRVTNSAFASPSVDLANRKGLYGQTHLHCAVKENDKAAVGRLLEEGASPFISDDDGLTPIDLAIQYEHLDLVAILLRKALPEQLASSKIGTVEAEQRHIQIRNNHLTIVKNAEKNWNKWGTAALDSILLTEDPAVFHTLPLIAANCGITFQEKSPYGLTRLQEFVLQGDANLAVRWAEISQGKVDLSVKDRYGNNLLHLAFLSGNLGMAAWLLEQPCILDLLKERNGMGEGILETLVCSPRISDELKGGWIEKLLELSVNLPKAEALDFVAGKDIAGFTAGELIGALAHAKDPLRIDSREWKILTCISLLWLAIAFKEYGMAEDSNSEWFLDQFIACMGVFSDTQSSIFEIFNRIFVVMSTWKILSLGKSCLYETSEVCSNTWKGTHFFFEHQLDPVIQLIPNIHAWKSAYKTNMSALSHLKGRPWAALKRMLVTNVQLLHRTGRLAKGIRLAWDSSFEKTPLTGLVAWAGYKVTHTSAADVFWKGYNIVDASVGWVRNRFTRSV